MDDASTAYRILVVDDEDVAQNVQSILQADDVVVRATDAIVACERITRAETDGTPFGVVLCRIDIDRTRGRSIVRVLNTCAVRPVFIYMARYFDDGIEAADPGDGILIKPFSGEELERLIEKIVMKRSRERTIRHLSDEFN